MFLPSGRVHAIGAGLVIFEVQQNSDTTYRVFDWNRAGLDGKPRPLHRRESLESIDFTDFEPGLVNAPFTTIDALRKRTLAASPLFQVEEWELPAERTHPLPPGKMEIIGLVSGKVEIEDSRGRVSLSAGQFSLVPASSERASVRAAEASTILSIEAN